LLNIHSFLDPLRFDPVLSLMNYGKFFVNSRLRAGSALKDATGSGWNGGAGPTTICLLASPALRRASALAVQHWSRLGFDFQGDQANAQSGDLGGLGHGHGLGRLFYGRPQFGNEQL
jgi:hypothetical protein